VISTLPVTTSLRSSVEVSGALSAGLGACSRRPGGLIAGAAVPMSGRAPESSPSPPHETSNTDPSRATHRTASFRMVAA